MNNFESVGWLRHAFMPPDQNDPRQARDANVERGEEEYSIHDPRNPINKRRREPNK